MRRVVVLALAVVGMIAVAAGAFGRYWLRRMPKVGGIFPNGMAYARLGSGPKTLLFIRGGPGNVAPMGRLLQAMSAMTLRPFLESGYSVWAVTRKRDMPKGYTVEEMAEEYAELIADEFGGKVDLVIGEEAYGGMIGFCLAARHPDRFGHLVAALAGYELSDEGRALELEFARLMSQGRTSEAGELAARFLFPGLRMPGVARVVGALLVRMMFGETHPYFASDVIVEAEAVAAFDGREILPAVTAPVLVVGCDRDPEFSREVYEETARLIPDSTLRLYEDKTSIQLMSSTQFALDVLAFIGEPTPARPKEQKAKSRIHHDIWIQAPVEEVFALYCDSTRWPELWLEGSGEITNVSGPIDQVGTTFEGTMRIAGMTASGTMRIVEVEPQRLVRVQNDQGALGFTYRFETEGDGTRLSLDGEYETTGPLGKLADKVVLHRYMDRSSRHMVDKMKEIAEAKMSVTA